jgi:hypothetical protein
MQASYVFKDVDRQDDFIFLTIYSTAPFSGTKRKALQMSEPTILFERKRRGLEAVEGAERYEAYERSQTIKLSPDFLRHSSYLKFRASSVKDITEAKRREAAFGGLQASELVGVFEVEMTSSFLDKYKDSSETVRVYIMPAQIIVFTKGTRVVIQFLNAEDRAYGISETLRQFRYAARTNRLADASTRASLFQRAMALQASAAGGAPGIPPVAPAVAAPLLAARDLAADAAAAVAALAQGAAEPDTAMNLSE